MSYLPSRRRSAANLAAVVVQLVLVALVTWNRVVFDSWLVRFDVYTQFLPWYHHLGERVSDFDVPGWNPHYLSGTPFAGHPLSGWMYAPAMLAFALFPVLTGFKVMLALHLALASLSTYALTRVLGMRPVSGLVASIVGTFGPFLEWNTYTSFQFAQFSAWIPLTLLGIELAMRRDHWQGRLVPWGAAAFAASQMLAGWIGEGWIYAVLLTGGYIGYRTLVSPTRAGIGIRARLGLAAATAAAVLGGGAALGAAGVLPRLAANAETNLAGGNYAELGPAGILNPPWEVPYLVTQVLGMGNGYHFRAAGFGGTVVVLMLLGLLLARQRFAVPFFASLTVVAFVLTLDTTPLHHVVYWIPRYQDLHEHDPWRVMALASIGSAVLSGAAVEMVARLRGRCRVLPVVMVPLVLTTGLASAVGVADGVAGWAPLVGATAVTVIALAVIGLPPDGALPPHRRWVPSVLLALTSIVVFLQPTGLELTGSWLGWPEDPRWERRWNPDPAAMQALVTEVQEVNQGGSGEYLQQRLATSGPFRYLGYGGVGHPDGGWPARTYMTRRFDPHVQSILVNGRPTFLGLYEIQGYDPIQLARYVEFIAAINGKDQNYHTAFLSDEGVDSPLLKLLNVRYVLIDASLPADRADIVALTAGFDEVLRNEYVIVYERTIDLPHAWIVHDVRQVDRGEALPLLANAAVDPYQTSLVEGPVPPVAPVDDPATDRAVVLEYRADTLVIETRTAAAGVLVISDIYADGWRAVVDGDPVPILPTHHALRGVPIPAGDHVVELRYEPIALRVGIWISGGAWLMLVGALCMCLRGIAQGRATLKD